MGKLKLYNLESEYLNDKSTHDDSTVSYVLDSKEAKFQENGGYFKAIYNVTSTTSSTQLIGNAEPLNDIKAMFIDGEELDLPVSAYTFTTTGYHRVTCVMKGGKVSYYGLFSGRTNVVDIDVTKLNTSNVTNMSYMFYNCSDLTSIDVSNFDTSNVTNMNNMFSYCSGLTSLILTSDISHIPTNQLQSAFSNASSNLTIYHASACDTTWYCGQKVSTELANATFVPALNPNLELTYITSTISPTSTTTSYKLINANGATMESMTINGSAITPTSAYTFSEVGDYTIEYGIIKEITKSYNRMFYECKGLTSIDLSNFDASNVTDMQNMFYNCTGLTSVTFGDNFDTSNVTTMGGMFYECKGLTSIDVSNFDTSNVITMQNMFYNCRSLTSLDVSNFNTSNVTNMYNMFYACSGLTSIDVSNFDTSNVTSMHGMFSRCSNLTSIDLSNFDTSNVTLMSAMFNNSSGLTSIRFGSQADVSKVTSYGQMFYGITTTGTLYYPSAYADSWNNLLVTQQSSTQFPSTWTAVDI